MNYKLGSSVWYKYKKKTSQTKTNEQLSLFSPPPLVGSDKVFLFVQRALSSVDSLINNPLPFPEVPVLNFILK